MTVADRRSWKVQVNNVLIRPGAINRDHFAIRFEVMKSYKREPNTATIRIANLGADRRQSLEELDEPQITIDAGYNGLDDTIFTGDARDIYSETDGAEIWTVIEAEDGGTAYRTAALEESYGPNVPVSTVIRACATAMGVGMGNAESFISDATLDTSGGNFGGGTVLSGPAWRSLDRICRSCSLRWSIQNGVLQLRQAGRPAETTSLKVSPTTGMIGSPKRGRRDERTDRVSHSVKTILLPSIYPGRVLTVESKTLNGGFLVRRVEFSGDTQGPDWYAESEIEEY